MQEKKNAEQHNENAVGGKCEKYDVRFKRYAFVS